MKPTVLTVSQVNFFVKSLLEGDGRLSGLCVAGEVSNLAGQYRSGHVYFSLKDQKSVLRCVMFAPAARRLRFSPQNGMGVVARGRVSVYEPTGQYQLYVEDLQPDGVGALALAYEQLRDKLAAEGLFDQARKRPLPPYPERIGVVTSPSGAAVRDILQVTARRWPVAEIVFCPVLVQGEGAPAQLTAAIEALGRSHACDVAIVGRGGGSMEDLWAFNDEALARAVAGCPIPVVSAVGHETDFTICDFAADLRAPTPSAAAELCTPDILEERQRVRAFSRYFQEGARDHLAYLRQSVDILAKESPLGRPEALVRARREKLRGLTARLAEGAGEGVGRGRNALSLLAGKLDSLSPLRVLSRGYSVVYDGSGRPVREAAALQPGDAVSIRLAKGSVQAEIIGSIPPGNRGK